MYIQFVNTFKIACKNLTINYHLYILSIDFVTIIINLIHLFKTIYWTLFYSIDLSSTFKSPINSDLEACEFDVYPCMFRDSLLRVMYPETTNCYWQPLHLPLILSFRTERHPEITVFSLTPSRVRQASRKVLIAIGYDIRYMTH